MHRLTFLKARNFCTRGTPVLKMASIIYHLIISEQMRFCDTWDKSNAKIAFTVFVIYMNIRVLVSTIIHSTVFAGTVYCRPIPTKISHRCTNSFPDVAISNPGPFLQRDPGHKSDSTMQATVCGKNLVWKNGLFKEQLQFFFACLSNWFLNTTRECL